MQRWPCPPPASILPSSSTTASCLLTESEHSHLHRSMFNANVIVVMGASNRWQDLVRWWNWQEVTCAWDTTERMGPRSCTPPCLHGTWGEHVSRTLVCVLWSLVRRRVNIGKYKQDYCQGGDNIKCWDLFKCHIEYSDIICNVIKMEFGMDLGKVNLRKLILLNIYNWNNWYGYYQLRIQHFLDFSFSGLQELAIDII